MTRRASASELLLPLLAGLPPLVAFVGATIDGQQKVRDSQGYLTWTSTSNQSGTLAGAAYSAVALIAFALILNDLSTERRFLQIRAVLVWWPLAVLIGQVLRGDIASAVTTAVSILILLAVTLSSPSDDSFKLTARVVVVAGLAVLVYAFLNPQRALIECRPDKCTPLGGMLTSFMPQENVLGLFALAGLTVVVFALAGVERIAAVAVLCAIIAFTGSRGALVGEIGVLGVALVGHMASKNSARISWSLSTLALIPIALTLMSGIVFFFSGILGTLTGRDFIYDLVHHYWLEQPLIGPGRQVLLDAYQSGNSANYLISHEHGQIPYLLTAGGIVGAFFFLFWVSVLSSRAMRFGRDETALLGVLVGMSLLFVTEPSWQFDVRSPTFWTLVMAGCLYSRIVSIRNEAPTLQRNIRRKGVH